MFILIVVTAVADTIASAKFLRLLITAASGITGLSLKNTTTGWMRIYLNGAVWAIGNGKSKAISIMNMILGKDNTLNNNYKGKINQLSIWDKELPQSEIQAIMNSSVTASHPSYSNLNAY